ncbi:hypothetical protein C8F04DRAFT_1195753 [Mycena alexandri]|uniref:Uncharacterized protein n=1 Tax=Mycena alexandri TaxID=1745969 RepID=A0AAD6WRT8_9AGAR|nr:hypothetical protein C8F04DRAFT_1195753 [Mycena alexandri]
MSNYLDIQLDPSLFAGLPGMQLETMGHGDDADYVYDPTNPIFSPTNPMVGSFGTNSGLSYPPPSPSLALARSRLAELEEDFPPSVPLPPRSLPLGDAPINLPRGAFLSSQADATKDNAPAASGKRQEPAAGRGAENQSGKKTRAQFGGRELIQLARAVVLLRPYFAPNKGVGDAWKALNLHLRDNSFPLDVKYTTLQTKAKALIKFKKDPECEDAKSVATHIKGDTAVLIASALEAMEAQYDEAKDKTDEAKLKLKEKSDADRTAGNAIRNSSLGTRKRRAPPPNTSPAPEEETPRKGKSAAALSATSSVESIDGDQAEGSQRKAKCRKTDRRSDAASSSSSADLVKIIEKDMQQREEQQRETTATMRAVLQESKEGRDRLMGILEKLIEKD